MEGVDTFTNQDSVRKFKGKVPVGEANQHHLSSYMTLIIIKEQ